MDIRAENGGDVNYKSKKMLLTCPDFTHHLLLAARHFCLFQGNIQKVFSNSVTRFLKFINQLPIFWDMMRGQIVDCPLIKRINSKFSFRLGITKQYISCSPISASTPTTAHSATNEQSDKPLSTSTQKYFAPCV